MLDKLNKHYYVSEDGVINDILAENGVDHISLSQLSINSIKKVVDEYKPDVVEFNDFKTTYMGAVLAVHLRKKGIKVISRIHNDDPDMTHLSMKSLLFLLSTPFLDQIIGVSDSVRDEYLFKKTIEGKYVTLSNIVNEEWVKKKATEFETKKYDICCIATFRQQKRLDRFLYIISVIKKSIPDLKVVLIGDGELHDEILKIRKELGLESTVELLGFKENPYPYLRNSKIFMLTSGWEGFGLVAVESLILGKPAIVSNVGGLPKIIDESVGAVAKLDTDFISSALELLENADTYKSKTKNISAKLAKVNQIGRYCEKLNEIYEQKLG
jgi:glycosyltransferase involved in cell wall biosynthesis